MMMPVADTTKGVYSRATLQMSTLLNGSVSGKELPAAVCSSRRLGFDLMAEKDIDDEETPLVRVRCGHCDTWAPRRGITEIGGRPVTDSRDSFTVGELMAKGWMRSSSSKSGWLCPDCRGN
jgi:hypothetical protein